MNFTEAQAHLSKDPHIARVMKVVDLQHPEPSGMVYHDLLDSIVSQQLSVKAAATIFNRFLDIFPDRYPAPELLLEVPDEQLRGVGLSNQKAQYLKNVARYFIEHQMEETDWSELTDEEIVVMLSAIKGVGKWTVQMVLMFTLGRPDVFPHDDLGIQQGMVRLFGLTEEGKHLKVRMEALAEPWRPYRTVACRYLWRFKDGIKSSI